MKHWSSPPRPRHPVFRNRRIPMFHPVPVVPRADGWTPERQAAFIGYLAQTRSVLDAARAVRMGRESAYRLRKRYGAAGFAAAWDAALGKPHAPVNLASAKSTEVITSYRAEVGLLQVVMAAGRYTGTHWKADANAVLEQLAQRDSSMRDPTGFEEKPHSYRAGEPSTASVDFAS